MYEITAMNHGEHLDHLKVGYNYTIHTAIPGAYSQAEVKPFGG